MKKASWTIIGILATLISFYPITYFFIDRRFGLLSSKSAELLNELVWNVSFYGHITLGGIALLVGWLQFSNKIRIRKRGLHKNIGKIYMITALLSGICGLYIALHASGGLISVLGFFTAGVVWVSTTILGFTSIKKGNVTAHKKFMTYSYAACFAAVTLRLWLPLLTIGLGEFVTAYRIVAWLSWVPNIIVAYFIVKYNNTPIVSTSTLSELS